MLTMFKLGPNKNEIMEVRMVGGRKRLQMLEDLYD